eukprot:710708-Rhodomonas_salina.3
MQTKLKVWSLQSTWIGLRHSGLGEWGWVGGSSLEGFTDWGQGQHEQGKGKCVLQVHSRGRQRIVR